MNKIDEMIDLKQNTNVETKKLMKSFSLDVIANVVFSLKTNTYKGDDFLTKAGTLFNTSSPISMLSFILPRSVSKFFDISLFDSKTIDYFAKLALTLIEERRKNADTVYNDFIGILLKSEVDGEVLQNQLDENGYINRKLSTEEIVGRCLAVETIPGTLNLTLI